MVSIPDRAALQVGWGIGNTKQSVEECAEACRQHVPKGDGTPPPALLRCVCGGGEGGGARGTGALGQGLMMVGGCGEQLMSRL